MKLFEVFLTNKDSKKIINFITLYSALLSLLFMGVRKNFGFNIILTGANYIFPLLVFPYITRIFDAELIGICNFVESIVNYLVMFSALGLGAYGVREVARAKGNRQELDTLFSSLLFVNIIMTAVWITIYIICIYTVPQLYELRDFCLVGCIKILTSCFLVEWLFQGLEQFKYITFRAIVVRTFFVISVFLFVKSKNDVLIYFSLMMLTVAINALVNILYSKNFVSIRFKNISIRKYLVPVLSFGYYTIFVYFYTTFNSIFLGFVTNETEVGYYSIAAKVVTIALSVFTALNTVMIPRITKWMHEGENDILNLRINQCILLLILLAGPISFFCFIYAPEIVNVIAGSGYEGAVTPLRIVSVLILTLGLSQVIVAILASSKSANKSLIMISSLGAVIGLTLNGLLTYKIKCLGSCISWTVTEICVLTVAAVITLKVTDVRLELKKILVSLFSIVIFIPALLLVSRASVNQYLNLFIGGVTCSFLLFFVLRYWMKGNILRGILPSKIERFLIK